MEGPAQSREEATVRIPLPTAPITEAEKTRFPKLHFVLEFLQHCGLIWAVDLIVRLFAKWIAFIEPFLPLSDPPQDLTPYIPVSVTRVLVTVMDAVAILLSIILGIVTIIKIAKLYWRSLK